MESAVHNESIDESCEQRVCQIVAFEQVKTYCGFYGNITFVDTGADKASDAG